MYTTANPNDREAAPLTITETATIMRRLAEAGHLYNAARALCTTLRDDLNTETATVDRKAFDRLAQVMKKINAAKAGE